VLSPLRPSHRKRTLVGFVATVVLLTTVFTFLKISFTREKAAQDSSMMITGSISSLPAVRKSPSNDPTSTFLTLPSKTQSTHWSAQSAGVDRSPIPLPRPRPKRT